MLLQLCIVSHLSVAFITVMQLVYSECTYISNTVINLILFIFCAITYIGICITNLLHTYLLIDSNVLTL